MSKTTFNYALIKPDLTDVADITAMNSNWDTIDFELNRLDEDKSWVYGTTDLIAGTSELTDGQVYLVYE